MPISRALSLIILSLLLNVGAVAQAEQQEAMGTHAALESAKSMEAAGRWRDAIPMLQRIATLDPSNVEVRWRLGRMLGWSGQRDHALPHLRFACETSPTTEHCIDYAETLSWSDATRADAQALLRRILVADPSSRQAKLQLGRMLVWNAKTRSEGVTILKEAVAADPNDADAALTLAEALSWTHESRAEALAIYEKTLAQDANNGRALTGTAQILAWSGRTNDALQLYDQVLKADPKNEQALRGRAEILNWRGNYADARALLAPLHTASPEDAATTLELARSNFGLRQYRAAQSLAQTLGSDPETRELRADLRRSLGAYTSIGYAGRRNRQQLDYDRLETRLSLPIAAGQRLTFGYRPTYLRTKTDDFNSNFYSVAYDAQPSEFVTASVDFNSDTHPGYSTRLGGGTLLTYRPVNSVKLSAGFRREAVEESLLSQRGEYLGSTLAGQVSSNLATVGVSYDNAAHGIDFSVEYSDGLFTGSHLDSNRRKGVDFNLGKSIRGDRPYIRLAYGLSYVSFDYDADQALAGPNPRLSGGYFSPTAFLLNYAGVSASGKIRTRLQWTADATAGIQNVDSTTARFADSHFASSIRTGLIWRVTDRDDVQIGYEFLNVYNAFRRNIPRITWRHYF
ncbi:MAG TPA: tetratricopeptide repeat protein [Clostridia bacterium]|nr:tetratricopeptide repeat protein [Clostridia bacterium]